MAFKAVGLIHSSWENLISIFYDSSMKSKWMKGAIRSEVIEEIDDLHRVEYHVSKAPWPLQDRDFVYSAKIVDLRKNYIKFRLKSVRNKKFPKSNKYVRAELIESIITVTKISKNKSILVIQILTDPKGIVPKWIVNMVQKNWPLHSFDKIRQILRDKNFKLHPKVVNLLKHKRNFASVKKENL